PGQYGLCGHMIDVAVARVASHAAEPDVLGLDGSHLVPRDGALRRPHVDPVEPRRVASEDRRLRRTVCSAERREAVLLLHIGWDLESAERLDLPLRRAIPEGVGAP